MTTDLPMRRISVVGSSGSGKTTVATKLARRLELPHIELDALFWGPDWQAADETTFRARVAEAVAGDAWVCDGNYSAVRDIVLARADTLVWLDLPYAVVVWRTLTRTLVRTRTRVELWNGNREAWRRTLGRESLVLWVVRTHHGRRRRWEADLRRPAYGHLRVVRLRSRRSVERWLASVG